MTKPPPTNLDRKLAKICRLCPACTQARRRQSGIAYWLVRKVETRVCPFCRAYERVYGRPAHERSEPLEA